MNSNNIYTEMSANLTGKKKDQAKSGFQGSSYAKMAKSVIIGTIISLFSSLILLLVFAFIVNSAFGDPDKVLNIFAGVAASAGALIGGFQASKRNGSNGLVSGFITGLLTSLVIFAVMIFNGKPSGENGSDSSAIFRIALVVCEIVFASIGGIFAVNSHSMKSRNYSSTVSAFRNKKK